MDKRYGNNGSINGKLNRFYPMRQGDIENGTGKVGYVVTVMQAI